MNDGAHQIELTVNGHPVAVPDRGQNLLAALREDLRLVGAKDGCSPQGQCGCCTVLVDGSPRVACVTPIRRVRGRSITTIEGLDPERLSAWTGALGATGGSQCGFCTPGIVLRLEAALDGVSLDEVPPRAEQSLLAHVCRCTGWQTIVEAAEMVVGGSALVASQSAAAARRASIEGGVPQVISPESTLGGGGFSADTAPEGSLVAVRSEANEWVVGETLDEARRAAGKVQGRRSSTPIEWPLGLPDGDWVHTIRTTWVEPGYLETDAVWCEPGGSPSPINANGGAFGAKADSPVLAAARSLADRYGRTVLALASREDVTRWGPKRPPLAGGIRADGTGLIRVVATPGIVEAISTYAPSLEVEEVEVDGPATSAAIRGAGWAEAAVLLASVSEPGWITSPAGGSARAEIVDGEIRAWVRAGEPLDEVVLRSYCIGAAHMAWSWLTSESLSVVDGVIADLTVRSFGIVSAQDMPRVVVEVEPSSGGPVNGSDAVFAAVAAAGWNAAGWSQDWPVGATMNP